ncbi:hypothetical protein DPEC_G00058990 [Dallia pectoralis]|uniref:Uncharacterized protein n=1 Tax=Dallia pectoralis TaxID=75939 RepID=A0ACC2H6L5_DALPE|nr:hypothetical protein DPEC_G00058990 [Dallia pectoralis]
MDDLDGLRGLLPKSPSPEDVISLSLTTSDSINIEDGHYSVLLADLEADAHDLDKQSWSVSVDQQYLKSLTKDSVKRQDVIYELIQTEAHHVRNLKLLISVYRYELRNNLQMDEPRLERMFPEVDILLYIHQHFLSCLRERRDRLDHYTVRELGDVLINQFSGEVGERMKVSYGKFCSRHTDAVSFYKEQLQTNKKFQNLVRKIRQIPIVRRLEVPECILLVTQRITKYPILVERILQNTDADSEEHGALVRALVLIKETITAVDSEVNERERASRLDDIVSRLDPNFTWRMKEGQVLQKDDLRSQILIHEGTLQWRSPNGRLKEIQAVLLSDILLLLQKEKDQKITFANLDNKPPVISLQLLIIREMFNDDKAMYLMNCSTLTPEMYEMHVTSKEECDTWISLIRDAAESCTPEQDNGMLVRLREFQELLCQKDAQVEQSLTEKLQTFTEMAEAVTGLGDLTNHSGLLFHGDPSDVQQGEPLLRAAIADVATLQNLLVSNVTESHLKPPSEDRLGAVCLDLRSGVLPHDPQGLGNLVALNRAKTFGGYDLNPVIPIKNGGIPPGEWPVTDEGRHLDRSQHYNSDPQDQSECFEMSADEAPASWSSCTNPMFNKEVMFYRLQLLSQKLSSLLAVVSKQDSYIELQRATSSGYERSVGNELLEKEKQRNREKRRQEMDNFHKLQTQHKQERARWEKEQERQQRQTEAVEAQLKSREEECRRLEEKLAEERRMLEDQRQDYQKDLVRLRESTQTVEKEKERLNQQLKLKKNNSNVFNHGSLNLNSQQCQSFRESLVHSSSYNGDLQYSQSLRENVSHSYPADDLSSRWSKGEPVTSSLTSKVHARPSFSLTPGFFIEQPPEVPPRRESISPAPPKPDVPFHLISTTNQVVHKQGGIQQQIPTKLATEASSAKVKTSSAKEKTSSAKEKTSKKGSRQTHNAASIDISQVVPITVIGKESGSLKGKKMKKKNKSLLESFNSDGLFSPPEPLSKAKPSLAQSPSVIIRINDQRLDPTPEEDQSSSVAPPVPPPFPKDLASQPTKPQIVYL